MSKQYYLKNKVKWKSYDKNRRIRCRRAVIELLGGKCIICGFMDIRALQVDHVLGGGNKDRKTTGRFTSFYILKELLNKSEKYQLLCANCNWIKKAIQSESRA